MKKILLCLVMVVPVGCGLPWQDQSGEPGDPNSAQSEGPIVVIEFTAQETTDADEIDQAVEGLEDRLSAEGLPGASVTADGETITVEARTELDVDALAARLASGDLPQFRPVLALREGEPRETDQEDLIPDQPVTVVSRPDGSGNVVEYDLGPSALDGRAIERTTAGLSQTGEWEVRPEFLEGPGGIDAFNKIASVCNQGGPQCPGTGGLPGQLAVVVDGKVVTAPTISEPRYQKDQITISGSFTEEAAHEVALAFDDKLPFTLIVLSTDTRR